MTKEDLLSGFLYLVMAAAVVLVGFLYIRPAFSGDLKFLSSGESFGFLLVSLLIGIVLNVLLFELGHIIGAKIGSYTILLTNILGFCFYKVKTEEGKLKTKFKFKTFSGLTGENKIAPKKQKSNPMFYVFMPLIFILIEFAAFYALNISVGSKSSSTLQMLKYCLAIVFTIGACIAFYNYFPAKLDSINDGYRLVLLSKKVNIEAYNESLIAQQHEFFNEPYDQIKIFDEITDFTAQVNNESAMHKFINGETEEALSILDQVITNGQKISKNTLRDININKAYIYFLTKSVDEGKEFIGSLDSDVNLFITNLKSLPAIRTYILYIGLVEKSKSEVEFALSRVKKFKERVSEGTMDKELSLINRAVDFVKENTKIFEETEKE